MFSSVLIANRGEIAIRIIRTLRRLGVRSVVACSIPDRHSLAVRMADEHVLLDGSSAAETYLDGEAIIAAARAAGCEAVHPGYGFLSERAEFAERCAAAGIAFVGPPPAVLARMGDKSAARHLASSNGVPVVPGWDGADDDRSLLSEAARIGFPIMIKARGGGGGRGMREVYDPGLFTESVASARREAKSAFGDAGLLIEKLLTHAHHVEVQVLADSHGNVIHLGERDCSVQRRHQKLIEETPSPVVDELLREEITEAALRLARAIGYVNAGTFEFLVAEPGSAGKRPFYFLEVNPRLQVEHPVTEEVTGIDLVELQLRIASGERLPFGQADVHFEGHAIELRINAEDPWDGFRPSTGRIRSESLTSLNERVDAGFEAGDIIPPHYDSLIGKIIVRGTDRPEAIQLALRAVQQSTVDGVNTNAGLHRAILASKAFRSGEASVDWLEGDLEPLLADARTPDMVFAVAAAGITLCRSREGTGFPTWVGAGEMLTWLTDGNERRQVGLREPVRNKFAVVVDGRHHELRVTAVSRHRASLRTAGDGAEFTVLVDLDESGHATVMRDGDEPATWNLWLTPPPPQPRRAATANGGAALVTSPLAGTVASIRVVEGQPVGAHELLLTIDAMKMEHRIVAPQTGVVKVVHVQVGDVVREGDVLIEMAGGGEDAA
ncbi:MAG: ATP-grasp domain-containing protein [Dehalococcoidia bacterium]|nr:ATP-grasp domain-containing protein [Dehalococcoidia bacterium]